MYLLCSLNVLPHEVFTTHLETLRKVIDFLVLRGYLELLRLTKSGPEYIPLGATWRNNADSRSFHGVDD